MKPYLLLLICTASALTKASRHAKIQVDSVPRHLIMNPFLMNPMLNPMSVKVPLDYKKRIPHHAQHHKNNPLHMEGNEMAPLNLNALGMGMMNPHMVGNFGMMTPQAMAQYGVMAPYMINMMNPYLMNMRDPHMMAMWDNKRGYNLAHPMHSLNPWGSSVNSMWGSTMGGYANVNLTPDEVSSTDSRRLQQDPRDARKQVTQDLQELETQLNDEQKSDGFDLDSV